MLYRLIFFRALNAGVFAAQDRSVRLTDESPRADGFATVVFFVVDQDEIRGRRRIQMGQRFPFPCPSIRLQFGAGGFVPPLQAFEPSVDLLEFRLLFRAGEHHDWLPLAAAAIDTGFFHICEERGQTVKVFCGIGIELVVVTLGTPHSRPHPDR